MAERGKRDNKEETPGACVAKVKKLNGDLDKAAKKVADLEAKLQEAREHAQKVAKEVVEAEKKQKEVAQQHLEKVGGYAVPPQLEKSCLRVVDLLEGSASKIEFDYRSIFHLRLKDCNIKLTENDKAEVAKREASCSKVLQEAFQGAFGELIKKVEEIRDEHQKYRENVVKKRKLDQDAEKETKDLGGKPAGASMPQGAEAPSMATAAAASAQVASGSAADVKPSDDKPGTNRADDIRQGYLEAARKSMAA